MKDAMKQTIVGGGIALSGTVITLIFTLIGFYLKAHLDLKEKKKEVAQQLLADVYRYKDKIYDTSLKVLTDEYISVVNEDRYAIRAAQMIHFPELTREFIAFSDAVEDFQMFYILSYANASKSLDKKKEKELSDLVVKTLTAFELAIQKKI